MAPKVVMTMADWRLDVLLEPERTGQTVAEVCRRHEISRQTFYAWRRRFDAVGIAGLLERDRTPLHQPRRIDAALEQRICTMRRQHPRWGARTIRTRLQRAGVDVPSISTVHRVLRRNHLVVPDPTKKPKALLKRFERDEPNDLWQMDATEIRLSDGTAVEVVTTLDDHARFMLSGVVCPVTTCDETWESFRRAAAAYGLPRQVFTDNHLSFSGRRWGREVMFERKLRSLDVQLIHGRPYHPQGRGKIERFHKTLKDFIEDEGGADDLEQLQEIVDRFRSDYNLERPHQAIGDITPAERYRPSARALGHAEDLQDPNYGPGSIIRKTSSRGVVCWNHIKIAIGRQWGGRLVKIEPTDGWIHILFGEQNVRSVRHHPGVAYHPLPKRRAS